MNPLIERLAREAGVREERWMTNPPEPTGMVMCTAESLERFAALVAQECARVCDERATAMDGFTEEHHASQACAELCRAAFPLPNG